jgi:hypothetical protein
LTWGDNSHGEDLACDSKSKDSWNLWHAREGTILLEKPDFFYKSQDLFWKSVYWRPAMAKSRKGNVNNIRSGSFFLPRLNLQSFFNRKI